MGLCDDFGVFGAVFGAFFLHKNTARNQIGVFLQLFGTNLRGIVAVPFEHLHRAAHLVFAAKVGGTLREYFHHREPLVCKGLFEQRNDFLDVKCGGAGHKGCTRAHGQVYGVEFVVNAAVGSGGSQNALARERRILAAGHAVDAVVHDDGNHIDIAAAGVDKVVAANGHGVAIAHGNHHVKLWLGHLDARGAGQGAAMHGVHAVKIHIARYARRAANARNHAHV